MFNLGGEFDSCFSPCDKHNVVRSGGFARRLMRFFWRGKACFPPVWQVSCGHFNLILQVSLIR